MPPRMFSCISSTLNCTDAGSGILRNGIATDRTMAPSHSTRMYPWHVSFDINILIIK